MQPSKTIAGDSLSISPEAQRMTVSSEYLSTIQKRVALATVLIPFLGSLVAIGLLWSSGKIGLLEVGLLVVMYTLTMAGITVGFHRHFAHRAFTAKTSIRVILAILGSMAAQGPLIHWASNHRRHHIHSDQLGDPHSPHLHEGGVLGHLRGFWHAHVGWLFTGEVTNSAQFCKDLLQDPVIFKINRLYLAWVGLGLAIPGILGGIISWTWMGAVNGALWGGLVRIFLCHHATWSINSITHIYGRAPYDTRDHSRNNAWLALPTLGEAWHNNHHAFPGSAIFGLERLQIDLGGWVVRALESTGLIWDVKVPSAQRIEAKKALNNGL